MDIYLQVAVVMAHLLLETPVAQWELLAQVAVLVQVTVVQVIPICTVSPAVLLLRKLLAVWVLARLVLVAHKIHLVQLLQVQAQTMVFLAVAVAA
jgi:hypothetical protein